MEQSRTLMPGVVLRTRNGRPSVRFACMVNRKRFTATCTLPLESLVTLSTMRPTANLKAEYNMWVQRCEREAVGESPSAARPSALGVLAGNGEGASDMARNRARRGTALAPIVPSLEELIEAYENIATQRCRNPNYRKPTARSIETALKNVRYCMAESGIGKARPYTDLANPQMLREVFDRLCNRLHGISAWSYIMSMKSITASWTIPMYRAIGYDVKPVELPDVGNIKKAPEYKELTGEQKEKIQKWYMALAGEQDRRMYLAASFVAQLAVRPCDVGLLTAENFRRDEDDPKHVHLRYRPRKTLESSNRRVDWPIRPALWDLIVEVAGERLRNGETMLEAPRSTFDKLNRSMRKACGMEDWNKAVYELRKLCIDTVRREQGVDAAVALSGDRRETIDRYYSDPYKLNGIVPLEILPMG